jgi:hypothetical protein
MKTCQWCDVAFESKVSYQIYCSDTCRDDATKEKIAQRYAIARRNKLIGKTKACRSCGKPLSAYNEEVLCSGCVIDPKEVFKTLRELKGFANGKFESDQ